jgi:branched-subunit amino acid ABC-type transport system permease component
MFSAPILAQILWTSLATASPAVLFALAFALVLKVNRVFNFAQAGVMTAAFYAAYAAVSLAELPGWVGLVAALAAAVLLSLVLEWTGFATLRHRGASAMFVFIFTLVVSEMVSYIAMLVFGTWPATIYPSLFWPVTLVGPVAVSDWDLPSMGATIAAVAALFAFLRFTRQGRSITAVADNPELAEFYGIRRGRAYAVTMAAAGLLIGLGMFMYGARSQVQPTSAIEMLLFAVAATIMGGIGNLGGAVATAVVLGVVQNSSILFMPPQWQGFLLYVFLFAAIVFLPKGIRLPVRRKRLTRAVPTVELAPLEPGAGG